MAKAKTEIPWEELAFVASKHIAKQYGVSIHTVRSWRSHGKLPPYVKGTTLWNRADIEECLSKPLHRPRIFSDEEIIEIRKLAKHHSRVELGEQFEVSPSTISRIASRHLYADVED